MRSRSARKAGSVGASGARRVEANSRAGVIRAGSEAVVGLAMMLRISSMSCRRRREKLRGVFLSKSCFGVGTG